MDFTCAVAQRLQIFLDLNKRVPVFREYQQLSPSVLEIVKFGCGQAFFKCIQLGIMGVVTHTGGLINQVLKCGNLGVQTIDFKFNNGLIEERVLAVSSRSPSSSTSKFRPGNWLIRFERWDGAMPPVQDRLAAFFDGARVTRRLPC